MVYKCSVCGYVFDEAAEGKSVSELTECPLCKQPAEKLEPVSKEENSASAQTSEPPAEIGRASCRERV